MERTIEEALHQGVTAHKGGKLQDAESFYRAILQSQAALTLFKTSLEAYLDYTEEAAGSAPLYRFFNSKTSSHLTHHRINPIGGTFKVKTR